MTKREVEIEKKLTETVKRHGGRCLKWVCPGWSGVPDRIVLLPGAHIFFVELKRPRGGRLSPLQRKWSEWLSALGFYYCTIWTVADVRMFERVLLLAQAGDGEWSAAAVDAIDEAMGEDKK